MIPQLLNRSYYSFLNSTLSIEDIVNFAAENKHTHVVISDFQCAHSWLEFYKLARKSNLIPVFALHTNYKNSSILLIAKNKLGYANLVKIASKFEINNQLLENLILIHLDGDDILEHSEKYVANLNSENGVYVKENKFKEEKDFNFYCVLRAIANNSTLDSELSLNQIYSKDFLYYDSGLSEESIQVKNVYEILSKCEDYEIIEKRNCLSFFSNPKEELRIILEKLFCETEWPNPNTYRTRMEYEFNVLVEKGFCEYFLIVYDAVKWSKENDIYIGPGRGSVCGSLVAFILKITEIDPIKYDLYFERFLNLERTNVPDIDIDVENQKRNLLLNYLRNKYGDNNVALISVCQTFKIKNSIREISKILSISIGEIDYCLKSISNYNSINIHDLSTYPYALKKLFSNYQDLKEYVMRIHGFPKAASIHAAGVVISSISFDSFVPVIKDSILNIAQWFSDDLKMFGLIKFDFLALQYLSFLRKLQERLSDKDVDFSKTNLSDAKVYNTLISGKNSFIFQFENPKVLNLIKQFKPTSILDLALLSAVNRPGASDQIPTLLARKSSLNILNLKKDDSYEILKDTYGVLIYQEQLLKIVSFYTQCSFSEADTFRRDLSDNEEACKQWFSKTATKTDPLDLSKIWNTISKFAKYSFNKSHAVAYALISYRLMWFKTYYPEIFYSELLQLSVEEFHMFEIQTAGFNFAPPTYGKSLSEEFNVIKKVFYFPICKIAGISGSFLDHYRNLEGKAKNTLDAIKECVNIGFADKLTVKLLIKIGFFNGFFKDEESEHFWESNLDSVYESIIYVDKNNESIFDFQLYPYQISQEIRENYRKFRKESLGVDLYKKKIPSSFFEKYPNILPIYVLIQKEDSICRYVGFVSSCISSKTFRDIPFLWVKISDNFYTSPNIAYFDEDVDELKRAAAHNHAIVAEIEKKKEFYKIVKVKIFEKYD